MGSKKLKALVVEGNRPVYVKDPQAVADLSDYMLREIIGSNNNHVVPSTQQEWAEYYDEGSRWNAQKGLNWELTEDGPVETGRNQTRRTQHRWVSLSLKSTQGPAGSAANPM